MAFSDFEKLKSKKSNKHTLKDSKNNIIGIIDEDNNLLMINPNYKLHVSKTIQSNDNELVIINNKNYGFKISDSIKIITPDGETSIGDNHTHDYNKLNNLPKFQEYTDDNARNACNRQIDSHDSLSVCGYTVDNKKMLWTGEKIKDELNNKSNTTHKHDVKEIKNLPVSITEERVNDLIRETQEELSEYFFNYYSEYIKGLLQSYSKTDHSHDDLNLDEYYTENELVEIFQTCASVDHKHDFPKYTDDDVIRVIEGKKLINTDQLRVRLKNYANIEHTHSESEINDLDKYTKEQVNNLLSKYSKTDHTHKHYITKDQLYTDKDVKRVLDSYINYFVDKPTLTEMLENYAKDDHVHEHDIDQIFNELKQKIKTFLDGNINSVNAQKLQGKPPQDFASSDHKHNFEDLQNSKHTHTEKELKDLDKYSKNEVNDMMSKKANSSHKHHVNDIIKFPKLYSDSNHYIQNNLINDGSSSNNTLFSSEKVEALINNRARVQHNHKLNDVQEIRGYIERTVETSVRNNVKNHKHSMFDITDKPTFYNDSQARDAIGGQVNDRGQGNNDLWSADKIQKELEYLKRLIDSK